MLALRAAAAAAAGDYDPSKHYVHTYVGNNALQFNGGEYVRVPHDVIMNAPLMNSWTIECWIKVDRVPPASSDGYFHGSASLAGGAAAAEEGETDTLNLVGFYKRHPTLAITRRGHLYTAVRDVEGPAFGYEGSTNLQDGKYHHVAATWSGTDDELSEQTLSLYVDGKLEEASGPLDDGSGVPKHPGMQGYNAASECTDNMCEEGMHIGGFYQPGGRGYTGQFFHGVIDEVRVWQKPRTQEELQAYKDIPLRAKDHMTHGGLLFYFPFDEQGMDSGQEMVVVESRAYPWFGLLGNSSGKGRPLWVESGAPLRCMVDSLARPCVEAGVGNLREVYAAGTGSGGGGGAAAGWATGTGLKRRYSRGAMAAAVLLSMLLSAAVSVALTRAVVVDGLELSCSADALPAAGRALARAVRGVVSSEPGSGVGSGAPAASGTSGLAPAVVPSPLVGGSGYQTVA